jgi:single-strand DNA-binding protein
MASFNRVILVGNLTRDPELRYLPSGMAVSDIGLAVNDRRKTPAGEWVEETTFVDVTLWGRTAEVASEYLNKGSPVLIEGRLKLDSWGTSDGQKRSKLKVVGEKMQMLGGKGSGAGEGGARAPAARGARQAQSANASDGPPPDEFEQQPPAAGDDIPF